MAGGSIEPAFDPVTNLLTIPKVPWATYYINGERVKGTVAITESTVVTAEPVAPSRFRDGTQTTWSYAPNASVDTSSDEVSTEQKSE